MKTGPGFAGCFGKVRGNGDFITRRLPPEFVGRWDMMLQAGLLQGRATLGDDWLQVYLNAPLWYFALGADVVGPAAWAGVLMPSVDRVGRHFPLTIAAPLFDASALPEWLHGARSWFTRCGELALATLSEGAERMQLEAGLAALTIAPFDGDMPHGSWRDTPCQAEAGATWPSVACERGESVWWTDGAETLAPSMRGCAGLPDALQLVGLFDGGTAGWPWHCELRAPPVTP
jgi:type VI secretion system protein ImpM